MSFTIEKDFAFSASHKLYGLPEDHQCARLHGHNYVVRVRLHSPLLNETGFVLDYGALKPFKEWVDTALDHRHLNEVLHELPNPTAEHMARYLSGIVRETCGIPGTISVAVGVSETPKTWAWFTP